MKSTTDKINSNTALQVDRRGFLTGVSVALTGVPLQVFGTNSSSAPVAGPGQRAVFSQQPYFNFDGSGESYAAPRSNQTTRDYVASISHEEFLRRHWFS